jgi:transposase
VWAGYAHLAERQALRVGTCPSSLVLGGRRVKVERPQARSLEGHELRLPSWRAWSARDPLDQQILESQLAATILSRYPTAASFRGASFKKLARIVYDGSHKIGEELARSLIEGAAKSVGSHHSEPYRLRIKYLYEDLDVLRRRLKDLAWDIERKLDEHEVGKLLTTIDRVGPLTAACLIAELGDPARFRSAGAIASYVGVAPRLRQSGKKRFSGSPTIPFGNARLRKALWMVVLNAVRCNPWLRQYYERLRAAGKPGKVAVIAALRKLLTAVWSVATHRKPFVPTMPARAAT